jgi:hypothetical protein
MLHFITVALLLLSSPAWAQGLCERLFMPEGYGLACNDPLDGTVVYVEPTEGVFASLSSMSLRKLEENEHPKAFSNPNDWLMEQAALDIGFLKERLSGIGSDPDNPMGGGMLDSFVEMTIAALDDLRDASVSVCKEPVRKSESRTDLYCDYGVGPLNYLTFSRVVVTGDGRYAMNARTMNEQRLQHFQAIANSFE